jgi:hypothetical protein
MESGNENHSPPGAAEWLCAIAIIGLFLVPAIATNHQQLPWGDEVLLVEPAMNRALGYGFHTYTCHFEDFHRFFIGNVPGYPFLMSMWLQVAGVNQYRAHLLNYLLVAAAVLLLWRTSARSGAVPGARWRLAMLACLLTCCATAYAAFNLRYDGLGMLLGAIAFACMGLRRPLSEVLLFVTGVLLPFCGLHLPACAVLVGSLAIVLRAAILPRLAWLVAGCATGLAGLAALYASHHVLGAFLAQCVQEGGQSLPQKLAHFGYYGSVDITWICLLAALTCLALPAGRRSELTHNRLLAAALVALIGFPVFLFLMRRYVESYAWISEIPAILLLFAYCARIGARSQWRLAQKLALSLIFAGCLAGTPKTLAGKFLGYNTRDIRRVDRWVASFVSPASRVYATGVPFFSAKLIARDVYFDQYITSRPESERRRVNIMIIDAGTLPGMEALLGGGWKQIGEISSGSSAGWIARLSGYRYDLEAFERDTP